MERSDRLLLPCFVASLALNALAVWAVSHSAVLDPNRRPPPMKSAEEPLRLVRVYRRPAPASTPRPVAPTPTPPPTPIPTPTPIRATPPPLRTTPTPPPSRPQVSTARPQTRPQPYRPQQSLGLGGASRRGSGPTINRSEVRGDLPTGRAATTTEFVDAPNKSTPAPPPPPPPTPEPVPVATATPRPATPAPAPPTPPPTPKPVVRRVVSTPATPLTDWDSLVSNFSLPDGVDPSELRSAVTVLIETDETGAVKSARVTQSSGSRPVDRFFENACRRARFKPPTIEGEPMPARFEHRFQIQ